MPGSNSADRPWLAARNKASLVDARRTYRERRPRTGPGRPRWLKEAVSASPAAA
ncbi:hypothetical protein [Streptomyces sp. CC0208]|uniref:hypothetical protein n=1 Tax=Streptomyces sp. CC0208 TaxID=2306165 RepID=UPI0002D299A7|nr:hypothetical protein [Streptomyces sp. CC0208]